MMERRPRHDPAILGGRLRSILLASGVTPAAELRTALALDRNAFARLLHAHADEVLPIGKGKATSYAWRRSIPGLGKQVPVYEVGADGRLRDFGILYPIVARPTAGGWHFASLVPGIRAATYDDWPYFLDGLRPQGFLGSLVPQRHPELGLPRDVRLWTGDHCVQYLAAHGWNQPSNLIVGEAACRSYLASVVGAPNAVHDAVRKVRYPEIAADVLRQGDPGSSAGGEQPKFLATLMPDMRSVLVKFSPPSGSAVAHRRADLLICEHLALETMRDAGTMAARSSLLVAGGRVFLEVERFDRLPGGGRLGVIAASALDAEFAGTHGSWSVTIAALADAGVVPDAARHQAQWLDAFGALIANCDRHLGNLAFFLNDLQVTGLTPAYDMTPWSFAPRADELVPFDFTPPLPEPAQAPVWRSAWEAATEFWRRAATDPRISEEFRAVAARCGAAVKRLAAVAEALPSF